MRREQRGLGVLTKTPSTIAAMNAEAIKDAWLNAAAEQVDYDFCLLTPEEDPQLERKLSWVVYLLRSRGYTGKSQCQIRVRVRVRVKLCVL